MNFPEYIRRGQTTYKRLEGLYLVRVPRSVPSEVDPGGYQWERLPRFAAVLPSFTSLADAIAPDGGKERCCCRCDGGGEVEAGADSRRPAPAVLNRPRGTVWVKLQHPTDIEADPELQWLPVYTSPYGVFALDRRILYLQTDPRDQDRLRNSLRALGRPEALGDGRWRIEGREPLLNGRDRVLDLDRLAEDLSRRHKAVIQPDPYWIPAASPAMRTGLPSAAGDLADDLWIWEQGLPWHLKATAFEGIAGAVYDDDPEVLGALLDSDIFLKHAEYDGAFVPDSTAIDATDSRERGVDVSYAAHGTCCAGVLVARKGPDPSPGGLDVQGVAQHASLCALELTDWNIGEVLTLLDKAIADPRVHVLSMSFSYDDLAPWHLSPLERKLYEAHRRGIVLVASAGNVFHAPEEVSAWPPIGFPAADPHVIAVGAVDRDLNLCWRSHGETWGSRFGRRLRSGVRSGVSVVAPGCHILTTDLDATGDTFNPWFNGTSAAAPQVAGLALHLVRKYSKLRNNPERVREIIEGTASKLDKFDFAWDSPGDTSTRNERVGYGMIHAQHALDLADVAVRAADVGINESGQVVVKVNNRGPADAQHVHVVAWRVPRVARWQFVRKGLGSYSLYDLGSSTLFEPITFSSTATNPSPDPEVLCEFVSGAALGTLDEGYELLVVVDAENDHAFHKALIWQGGSFGIDGRAPSLLRGYNNVAVVPRAQLGG